MFNGSNCCEESRVQNVGVLVQFTDKSSVVLSVSVFTWTELMYDNDITVCLSEAEFRQHELQSAL